jgi:hypothetical protein
MILTDLKCRATHLQDPSRRLDRAYRPWPGRTRSKALSLKDGDSVGLRLDGIQRDQVLHGDVLAC